MFVYLVRVVSYTCALLVQDRQILLIRDLLTSEGSSNSIQLSAEQRSALAFKFNLTKL